MKNLTKIFMAVGVALFAFACATDPTEDLGSNVSSSTSKATLTLSLEDTKTQLGDKVGNLYQLYWSEGDQISVNGVESNKLSKEQAGGPAAVFTVEASAPYYISYPVANKYEVNFAPEQTHNNDATFGSGVTTMYGTSTDGKAVQLHHLTGVLKFGVVGNGVELTHAQISTIDRAPIAGAFAIDFESGEVTPTESATSTIEYKFAEPVALSETPVYLHIAVPAGIYDELYVTLYDSNELAMVATVKATNDNPETDKIEKPLTAGSIREFSNLQYAANANGCHLIKDYASLCAFKEKIESAEGLNADALLINDVTIPEETDTPWSSINGDKYTHTLIGNGYAIKGLKAPLFNTTSASIKGLHLENVDINETECPNVGAFVRNATATDTITPKFSNCSASGKITVNYTGASIANLVWGMSGMFGNAYGCSFNHCTNNVELDIQQVIQTNISKSVYVGGVVGHAVPFSCSTGTIIAINVQNCTNNASIAFADISSTGNLTAAGTASLTGYVGGVVGNVSYVTNQPMGSIKNSTNTANGTITISRGTSNNMWFGGIVGDCYYCDIYNCTNRATVEMVSGHTYRSLMGGIAGVVQSGTLSDCQNYGTISIGEGITFRQANIGGVVGYSKVKVTDCTNYGPVTELGDMITHTTTYAALKDYRVGGVVGYTTKDIDSCTNEATGVVTISGVIFDGHENATDIGIGGVVGYGQSLVSNSENKASINANVEVIAAPKNLTTATQKNFIIGGGCGLANRVDALINSGNVTIGGTFDTRVFIGGCVGYSQSTSNGNSDSSNSGVVEIAKESVFNEATYIAGLAGCTKYDVTDCTNSGPLSIAGTFNGQTYIAGNTAWPFGNRTISGGNNSGAITITGDTSFTKVGDVSAKYDDSVKVVNINPFIAGCFANGSSNITGSNNSGAITIKGGAKLNSGYLIGGIASTTTYAVSSCENSGGIKFETDSEISNNAFISGGIAHIENGKDSNGSINNLTNRGSIEFYGTNAYRLYIGGCIGHAKLTAAEDGSEPISDVENFGAITLQGKMTTTGASTTVGGVACYIGSPATALTNSGSITVNHTEASSNMNVAGVIADMDYNLTDAHNYGAISVGGKTAGNAYSVYIGGVTAHHSLSVANRSNNTNSGAITFSTTSTEPYIVAIGGLFASMTRLNCTNCHNTESGTITVNNIPTISTGGFTCAGVAARNMDAGVAASISNCTNKAAINVNAEDCLSPIYVAGILASFGSKATTLTITGDEDNGNLGVENTGAITLTSPNAGEADMCLSGIISYATKKFTDWTGIVRNTGAITANMSIDKRRIMMGGLFGLLNHNTDLPLGPGAEYINTGNITCTGATNTTNRIGGIGGLLKSAIYNARCYCTVSAIGQPYVGMLLGYDMTDNNKAYNSHIGGYICKEKEDEGSPRSEHINDWTYIDYMYSTPIDQNVVADMRCGALMENINSTPIDVNGNEIRPVETED